MISREVFQFLKDLKINNNKEWFDENRPKYNAYRKEFEQLINVVIAEIGQFDNDSSQTSAKACIFRINRDIRFSNDKNPYKTNFGAFMAKGGRKGFHAGYYIHLEPGNCFLAGGIYMPTAPILKAIREEIYVNINEFHEIMNEPSFIKHFGRGIWGEQLKTSPKGFSKDFPYLKYLKYKQYTVLKNVPDRLYWQNSGLDEIREVFYAMKSFNLFLNRAIENVVE